MKKTNFTFRQKRRLKVKANSKLQVSLWFLCFVLFMGMSSLLHAQCTITCDDSLKVAIGIDGYHVVTPDEAVEGLICPGTYVEVYDENGVLLPGDTVTCAQVGTVVQIKAIHMGNSCTTPVIVKDNLAPSITCVDDTIKALELADLPIPFPAVSDNCTATADIELTVVSKSYYPLHCDSSFLATVERTFIATDASGNKDTCVQTLYVEHIDIDNIDSPENRAVETDPDSIDDPLLCDGSNWTDIDGDGYPDPNEFEGSVPTYNGESLYPTPEGLAYCEISVTFYDIPLVDKECLFRILRIWKINRLCPGGDLTFAPQVIEIRDTTPPGVIAPDDITVNAGSYDCSAEVTIPPATIIEDCSSVSKYIVDYPGGFVELDDPGSVTLDLSAGTHKIYFKVYNNCCFNAGIDSMTITVQDDTPPIAVCDQFTVTAVGIQGTARVYAQTFDDGSFDNCGAIDSMEVRRMDGLCGTGVYDDWGPYVEFCCEDLGSYHTVLFRVWDASGNSNTCMVQVEVQDKVPPQFECPSDITIACTYPYDLSDLSEFGGIVSIADLNALPGALNDIVIDHDDDGDTEIVGTSGWVFDNCSVTYEVSNIELLTSCGEGTIVRTFTFYDGAGNSVGTCSQLITIKNFDRLLKADINWPDDVTITAECDLDSLTPEWLESHGYEGFPTFDKGSCDLTGIAHSDMVFDLDGQLPNACFKIMRTWKVLDWCKMERLKDSFPGGNVPIDLYMYVDYQTIMVSNTVAPTFDGACADITLISHDDDCDSRYVELLNPATDDCLASSDLTYTWKIDADNDGDYDSFGNTSDASGDYGIGVHRIVWTVSDNCGNVNTCEYTFTVLNNKAATPIAYHGLAVDLTPVDTDGDGTIDDGRAMVTTSMIDAGSKHSCGLPFVLSFSQTIGDTMIIFTCADVGTQPVELWTYTPSNGAWAHVNTYVDVQANEAELPCYSGVTNPGSRVAGAITTTSDNVIPHVSVNLDGDHEMVVETNMQGEYNFGNVRESMNYTVNPELNSNALNGVSTWDLTLIQQYILGMNNITDPYLIIAADINKDMRISVLDLVDMRRTILGLNESFPNNKSWRFIDKDFTFEGTGSDVLNEDFPESFEIKDLSRNMENVNFYGLKVGDMNKTVVLPGLQGADSRGATTTSAAVKNVKFSAGELVEVDVTANEIQNIIALQYTMNYNPAALNFVGIKSGALDVQEKNFAMIEKGLVTMSWNAVQGLEVDKDETLFTLLFKAGRAGTLESALNFNNEVTPALVVDNNVEKTFDVEFRGLATEAQYVMYQNIPNPVTGTTVIGISLAEEVHGTMTFYDVTGKVLKTIEGRFHKGYNEVSIRKNELGTTGVVFYRFESDEFSATKKMVILK